MIQAPVGTCDSFRKISKVSDVNGSYVESILRTLKLCKELGIPVEARTTVTPGVSDGEEFIRQIAKDIRGLCEVYYLQQFDNQGDVLSPELKTKAPPKKEDLIRLARAAIEEGSDNVYIKTRFDGLERIK